MLYLPSTIDLGQGLVEYALILVLVSIVAIIIMSTLSGEIGGIYQEISNTLAGS